MLSHNTVKPPPTSWREKIRWLGPGVTWMAAGAGGAGELLFPPRVGSLYGYALLWALLMTILLKWFINREIGRYAVCSGGSLLEGYRKLKGPKNWAIWVIIIPQAFVATASLAGIAGSAATAFILLLPGSLKVWTGVTLFSTMLLLLSGSYQRVEKIAMVFAILLGLAGIITAMSVFPAVSKLAEGLRLQIPENVDYLEIIPWLSFVLAGAAGMTWYSYWIPAKGYGAAGRHDHKVIWRDETSVQKLKGWIRQMTLDNTLGVIGGLLIVFAFLVLGAELLGPRRLVPEENKIAEVLGKLLESTWGKAGFWTMIAGVLIGFWNTAMTNQDGWARLFTNGIMIVADEKPDNSKWKNEKFIRKIILWMLAVVPAIVFIAVGEPVQLLQIAGIIEAIHIPFIAALTLYINVTSLPEALRPSKAGIIINIAACLFFVMFAALYVVQSMVK